MLALTLLRAGAHASVPFSLPVAPPASVGEDSPMFYTRPLVDGQRTCVGGKVRKWRGPTETVTSPIYDATTGQRAIIGHLAQMSEPAAVEAVEAAAAAWDRGQGEWPQMTLGERIATIEAVVAKLKESRDRIVNVLMWEICKNSDDAAAEFDRTVVFIEKTIATLRAMDEETAGWRLVSGIMAFVRRAAIGVMLLLGPFNYPFNETYAALIPALLMGNCVVMKIPAVGGLAHVLTMGAWASLLPKGVLNFVSGSGRATVPPMMRTGLVDVLGFIGGSRASDAIIREHPQPHRLKTFLQLDAKNVGVVCADADLDVAVAQCVLGATSYNGQRCTAIKLILVHEDVADAFVAALGKAVAALPCGMPWEDGVKITPLPERKKPAYLEELIGDALAKGASLVGGDWAPPPPDSDSGSSPETGATTVDATGDGASPPRPKRGGGGGGGGAGRGGTLAGALMAPAVVYPVTAEMRLWHEEQFGPVVPVGVFRDEAEVLAYLRASPYGQQAALFTGSADRAAPLLDALATTVGRVNLNTQCGRSPDELPFSGRRSSALGTMSVSEALRAFSTETVVAGKHAQQPNARLAGELSKRSAFMQPLEGSPYRDEI